MKKHLFARTLSDRNWTWICSFKHFSFDRQKFGWQTVMEQADCPYPYRFWPLNKICLYPSDLVKSTRNNVQDVQQTVFGKPANSFNLAWFTLPDSYKIPQNPCQTVLNFFGFLFTPWRCHKRLCRCQYLQSWCRGSGHHQDGLHRLGAIQHSLQGTQSKQPPSVLTQSCVVLIKTVVLGALD